MGFSFQLLLFGRVPLIHSKIHSRIQIIQPKTNIFFKASVKPHAHAIVYLMYLFVQIVHQKGRKTKSINYFSQ